MSILFVTILLDQQNFTLLELLFSSPFFEVISFLSWPLICSIFSKGSNAWDNIGMLFVTAINAYEYVYVSNQNMYNFFQAVRLLGPPARFEASKLKVILTGQDHIYANILPRTYTLSHCDFTANLTLTISNLIRLDQLKGWYSKDDVVAEWKEEKGNMYLDVHCYVSGPNQLLDLSAEFRYYIFSKELPLVLQAVVYGDSQLFTKHQELMDALVRVYFHSSSKKYNGVECWGPLKDVIKDGLEEEQIGGLFNSETEISNPFKIWGSPKSILQALVAFLL